MDKREAWIADELDHLQTQGLTRRLRPLPALGGKIEVNGRTVVNFSSNDYLNLAAHPAVKEAAKEAIDRYGCGATASRLMAGSSESHEELEQELADWHGREAALVFPSGYATNVGTICALAGAGDAIFCDRLCHASIIDGARLSGAKLFRYRHCDCSDLNSLLAAQTDFRRRLVITDTVFSMDGDLAPIQEISALCNQHDAMLMTDEAHATGIFSPSGTGAITVLMGTMSKALGGLGGFVAGSRLLCDLLVNRARSFIYTTGLPPASVASALAAIETIRGNPTIGAELLKRSERFRRKLRELGLDTANSTSQIAPVLAKDKDKALQWSSRMWDEGYLAVAVRPPSVPTGSSRLRLSVTLAHSDEDLDNAAQALAATAREVGVL